MLAIPRMQLVFFPLNVIAGSETPFPPVQNLIGDAEILGFVSYTAAIAAFTPDGSAVVSAADAPRLVVTLQRGSDQVFQNIPYCDLARALNGGIFYESDPFPIDLTKCRIRTNGAITAASNAAIAFIYRPISQRR